MGNPYVKLEGTEESRKAAADAGLPPWVHQYADRVQQAMRADVSACVRGAGVAPYVDFRIVPLLTTHKAHKLEATNPLELADEDVAHLARTLVDTAHEATEPTEPLLGTRLVERGLERPRFEHRVPQLGPRLFNARQHDDPRPLGLVDFDALAVEHVEHDVACRLANAR